MAKELRQVITSRRLKPEEIHAKTEDIYNTVLHASSYMDGGNFDCIHPEDLHRLFGLYDAAFFDGGLIELVGEATLDFRLSKRMTRSGGHTRRRQLQDRRGNVASTEYEIAVSTTLLFQTFEDQHRDVFMSGIECHDRLQALQRVFEHELTHLTELLIWDDSSCAAPRFQAIAERFFGHTEHHHQLITPREQALTKYGIKAGDVVTFRIDGQHHQGVVNRITKRATVLVEDSRGTLYSDGKRYVKFYVPVGMLKPARS